MWSGLTERLQRVSTSWYAVKQVDFWGSDLLQYIVPEWKLVSRATSLLLIAINMLQVLISIREYAVAIY